MPQTIIITPETAYDPKETPYLFSRVCMENCHRLANLNLRTLFSLEGKSLIAEEEEVWGLCPLPSCGVPSVCGQPWCPFVSPYLLFSYLPSNWTLWPLRKLILAIASL